MFCRLESFFELLHFVQQAIFLYKNNKFIQILLITSSLEVFDQVCLLFKLFLLVENHLFLLVSVYICLAIESLLPLLFLHVSAILDWENSLVANDPLNERIFDLNVLLKELAPLVLKKLWISFGE